MHYSTVQMIIVILVITAGTMLTRFTPFIIFPEGRKAPKLLTYLGTVLPPAMIGLLVVYCLKGISFDSTENYLPELISIAFIFIIHKWKHNNSLSIFLGAAMYMLLITLVF